MSLPRFSGKHNSRSLIEPGDYVAYLKRHDLFPHTPIPESVILTFQPALVRHAREAYATHAGDRFLRRMLYFEDFDKPIGLMSGFGIGAPAAAALLEELIALGAKRFIVVGIAGALTPILNIGNTVLCTGAIRDEGVSHHYLDANQPAEPSPELTSQLRAQLVMQGTPFFEGSTWTIDTPYRETIDEVRHYQTLGVLTVEMEAAALFTVATHRAVSLAALFAISDLLGDLKWDPHFGHRETKQALEAHLGSALKALANKN